MRPYYPTPLRILPFFGRERHQWPEELRTELYLSFEDALWDLLPRLGVKRNSLIAIPQYYCSDVVENIKNHGYRVVIYPINYDFTFDTEKILKIFAKERPDVFIEFQYAGMRNGLLNTFEKKLDFRTLIVSDRIHNIVTSHIKYFPISDRHIVICSYRKVSPLPGALAIYSRNARKSQNKFEFRYTFSVLKRWIIAMILLKLSYLLSSENIGKLYEKTVRRHNNLVGDAHTSVALPNFLQTIYEHLDFEKISLIKYHQVAYYYQLLSPLKSKKWKLFHVEQEQWGELQGFPVVMRSLVYKKYLPILQNKGLLRYYQIENLLPARQKVHIILLPLGSYLPDKDIKTICNRLLSALDV